MILQGVGALAATSPTCTVSTNRAFIQDPCLQFLVEGKRPQIRLAADEVFAVTLKVLVLPNRKLRHSS